MWWIKEPIKKKEVFEDHFDIFYGWDDGLENFLENHPASSPYHSRKWQELITKTFDYNNYNIIIKKNKEIKAFLPLTLIKSVFFGKYFVSIAFADTCGILAEDSGASNYLLDNLKNIWNDIKPKYIEIRNSKKIDSELLFEKKEKILSYLYLPENENILWKSFDSKLRNQIRKALKSNITISFEKSNIKDFYFVYLRNMRDLGSPQLPFLFFKNLINIFKEESELIVLYKDNKPIGGAVGIYFKNTLEVPWASSIRDFFKYCPNNMLYWEILKRCIEKSIQIFSFGRSTVNSSTYNFKKQWGTIDQILNYQIYTFSANSYLNVSPNNPRYKLAINLWKKLPVFFTRFLGPFIAKGIG